MKVNVRGQRSDQLLAQHAGELGHGKMHLIYITSYI